jgi:hypothetical protein
MTKINPPGPEDSGIDRWRFCGLSPEALTVRFWKYGQAAEGEPSQINGYCEFPDKESFDKYVCAIIG